MSVGTRHRGIQHYMARELAVRHDLTVTTAHDIVKDVFRILGDELAGTGVVEVRGFGAFRLVPARTHGLRHPGTGAPHQPKSPLDIRFQSGVGLARRCNALRFRHRLKERAR